MVRGPYTRNDPLRHVSQGWSGTEALEALGTSHDLEYVHSLLISTSNSVPSSV